MHSLDGSLEHGLADSYRVSDDQKTYTFVLKDAHWSNGDPLTAYDFERSWKKAIDSDILSYPQRKLSKSAGKKFWESNALLNLLIGKLFLTNYRKSSLKLDCFTGHLGSMIQSIPKQLQKLVLGINLGRYIGYTCSCEESFGSISLLGMLKLYPEEKKTETVEEAPPTFRHGGNKLYFVSLGCPRNRVDTEVMLGILLKAGYEPCEALEEADYIIVNTCGFLEAAREESLAVIGEMTEGKKDVAKVIVTGCMVQTHDHEIRESFPGVDYLLGSGDVEGILRAIQAKEQGSVITTARSYLEAGEVPRQLSTPNHYAYLKIAEGCKKRCAYCIIPQIKGPLKSKSIDRIVKEFRTLREQGVQEIILIAQDLGDWGKDLGYKRSEGLIEVLKNLLKEEGDFWLRLLYLYPDEITPELIDLMKSDSRICPYLDMPIQHVNDGMLKVMHRATSREAIIKTLTLLRKEIPEIVIRTSLIVGFPGETEEQFEELVRFVQEYPMDNVGIFEYSKEEGSHAATLLNHLPAGIKAKRQKRLAHVQKKISRKRLQEMVGKTLEVVIEGYHPDSPLLMRGRHKGQCPEIDGEVIINDCRGVEAFGKRYQVKISEALDYDLVGGVVQKD